MKLNKDWHPSPESMLDVFVDWYNEKVSDFDVPKIEKDETYVVWFCYTLGNAKALISTTRPDHMYYELTYNLSGTADGWVDNVFVDQYLKVSHTSIERESKE